MSAARLPAPTTVIAKSVSLATPTIVVVLFVRKSKRPAATVGNVLMHALNGAALPLPTASMHSVRQWAQAVADKAMGELDEEAVAIQLLRHANPEDAQKRFDLEVILGDCVLLGQRDPSN